MFISLLLAAAALHPHPSPNPPATPAQPRANLSSYIRDGDYPPSALDAGAQGTVHFVLDVGHDGRVTDCRVTASSGNAAIDNATCSIMRRRARFTPARDADGNPTTDTVESRIGWYLR